MLKTILNLPRYFDMEMTVTVKNSMLMLNSTKHIKEVDMCYSFETRRFTCFSNTQKICIDMGNGFSYQWMTSGDSVIVHFHMDIIWISVVLVYIVFTDSNNGDLEKTSGGHKSSHSIGLMLDSTLLMEYDSISRLRHGRQEQRPWKHL